LSGLIDEGQIGKEPYAGNARRRYPGGSEDRTARRGQREHSEEGPRYQERR
jgi:hypothetical protein